MKSVQEKIADGEYQNKMEYPKKPSSVCQYCSSLHTKDAKFCQSCGKPLDYDAREMAYREKRKEYWREDGLLFSQFKCDLEAENGMADNPKREALFSKAWEHGHSSGLCDVLFWYEDLLELVK